MREIKFRIPVTSYATKKFLYFERWSAHHCCFFLPQGARSNDNVYGEDEQYTGFNDKNGREIYEGDVVANFGRRMGAVFYNQSMTAFWVGAKEWMPLSEYDNGLEVIGNIHENPELLKEE